MGGSDQWFDCSGSGKTQFLLSLLLAVQLAKPHGLKKRAVYISTEHPLATGRLSQLIECHPYLSTLPADQAPSLQNVLSINAMDLETQDHILNYQLPVAISRYNAGLVIIDSVTSNYRAEHSSNNMLALSNRSTELAKLGQMLRNLAAKENIAIVVANQVSDRFESAEGTVGDSALRPGFPAVPGQSAALAARESANASPLARNRSENAGLADNPIPSSSPASSQFAAQEDDQFDGSYIIGNPARNSILSLLHQERFFTGWGDGSYSDTSLKTPALGFFWSTQIACRIALKKEDLRTAVAPWDNGIYPLSTPREQADTQSQSQAEKSQVPKPVVYSAREVHTTETAKSQVTNEKDQSQNVPEKAVPSQKRPAPEPPEHITRRRMKLVFAPWTSASVKSLKSEDGIATQSSSGKTNELEFEIWKGGLRTARPEE
jgi:DNA repair protein RAD57